MNTSIRCLLMLVAPVVLLSCSRPQPPAPPAKVTVAHAQLMTVTNWDEYPGHLEAVEMVEIRPRVSGYIERGCLAAAGR
jgi:multidrug efflux pump subunit AcrA (membrane-fusion protein)